MQRSSLLLLEMKMLKPIDKPMISDCDSGEALSSSDWSMDEYIRALSKMSGWTIAEPNKKSKTHPSQDNRSREGVGGKK